MSPSQKRIPVDDDDDDKKRRRRSDYPFFLSYRTRWSDNDQYAHVNNAVYYHLIDAIVNTYLIERCSLAPVGPSPSPSPSPRPSLAADACAQGNTNQRNDSNGNDQIGLVVSSFCQFFSPLSFPDVLDLGLRVARLGRSSVTYEVGVFRARSDGAEGDDAPAAVGGYTHVFVDRHSRTSVAMSARTRAGLEKLVSGAVTRPKL